MTRMRSGLYCGMMVLSAMQGGCGSTMLSVSDTFRTTGMPSMLDARVERSGGNGMKGIPGVPVSFYVHDRLLGNSVTDAMGIARLDCELPPESTHYRAEARIGNSLSMMDGLVFGFPRDRAVVVCDIDGTVSMTHYRELVFDDDDLASSPFAGAAAALTRISESYGLVYLTARPGFLLEKTKRWLEKNGFPQAPVITTPGLVQSIGVQKFKAGRIKHLKSILGAVAIGIGNADTDSEAYAMQGLMTIIIDDNDDNKFRSHAIILRDWKMVSAFFDANRDILENPDAFRLAVAGEQMIRRPIIPFQKAR